MRETNRTPEFLAKFPMGKIPAFESTDGVTIFESDAIAQYAAESGPLADQLMGSNAAERAHVRQWICFNNNELQEHLLHLARWRMGYRPYDEKVEVQALEGLNRALAALETSLKGKAWVAGTKLSLADISLASCLVFGYKLVIDDEIRPKYPNVLSHFKRVVNTDGVKEVFGEPIFVQKRQEHEG
jgi:elongation factor 1-gamma